MKAKSPTYYGIWANITDVFPGAVLATILGVSIEDMNDMASNAKPTPPGIAAILGHLCALHGAKPVLFQQWEDAHDVFVGSVAEGWMSFTKTNGWKIRIRSIGGASLLLPATPESLATACAVGWVQQC